jgi:ABC-type transport system involved in cytochrome bd biosynthesis fused ATPase/permease subunit
VIGRVASGKSSLLLSITGVLRRCPGASRVSGSLTYTAQTPFVLSCTLRDNVLFGKAFDRSLYNRVLEACCLLPDLEIMPQGDTTFILTALVLSLAESESQPPLSLQGGRILFF